MNNATLIVSEKEFPIVKNLVELYKTADLIEKQSHLKLFHELKKAELKTETEMPDAVVRLNSIVSVKTSFGRKDGLKLVMPAESNLQKRKLSIMSSLGSAIFGYREGDKVQWILPNGTEEITIQRVINDAP
jgi:regulator of nucleoside diphosphate kinase